MKALLLLLALSAVPAPAQEKTALQTLVVQPGDTLWGLSNRYLKDPKRWNEILKYNQLPTSDPTVALPGMTLRVPVVLIKENLRSARAITVNGEVLFRKKDTSEWKGVGIGLELFPADSVRTMRLAETLLRFPTGETLDIRENSLVILVPPRMDADAQLLKGAIGARRSRVMTASAKVTPKGADTEYTTRVLEDLRTLVQVYSGSADVEAQGKTVSVPAGFGSEVKLDQAPSLPTKLPPLPDVAKGRGGSGASVKDGKFVLDMPEAGVTRDSSGRITVSESARYTGIHLQAARDYKFQDLALDRVIGFRETFDFTQELRAGTYWWRLALVDPLGFESAYTAPERLDLDLTAPPLEILRPAEGERIKGKDKAAMLLVEGVAEPGANVLVNGRDVAVDAKGRFQTEFFAKEGPGTIKVEARNRWGTSKLTRAFTYEVEVVVAKKDDKPVLPEKTFEERILKPYLIPALTIGAGLLIIILIL